MPLTSFQNFLMFFLYYLYLYNLFITLLPFLSKKILLFFLCVYNCLFDLSNILPFNTSLSILSCIHYGKLSAIMSASIKEPESIYCIDHKFFCCYCIVQLQISVLVEQCISYLFMQMFHKICVFKFSILSLLLIL